MPVLGALSIGDGGGKEESRLLGCGLEKRPPCPRPPDLVGEAPTFGRRVSLLTQIRSLLPDYPPTARSAFCPVGSDLWPT